jgi:hypothetical protein
LASPETMDAKASSNLYDFQRPCTEEAIELTKATTEEQTPATMNTRRSPFTITFYFNLTANVDMGSSALRGKKEPRCWCQLDKDLVFVTLVTGLEGYLPFTVLALLVESPAYYSYNNVLQKCLIDIARVVDDWWWLCK